MRRGNQLSPNKSRKQEKRHEIAERALRYIDLNFFGARNDQKTFLGGVPAVLEKEGQIRKTKKPRHIQIAGSSQETRKSGAVLQARLMKCAALLLSFSIALPLHGQPRTSFDPSLSTSPLASAAAAKNFEARAFFPRAGAGVLGWFAGAAAGIYTTLALPHHDCHCDDPGLEETLTGLVIGSAVGATVGASLPSLGRDCKYRTRLGRALLGSVAGTLIGAVIAIPSNLDQLVLVVIPVSSASGAALAIGRC
jgi:hypothetical protein